MFTAEEIKNNSLDFAKGKELGKEIAKYLKKKPQSFYFAIIGYKFSDGKTGTLMMVGKEAECTKLFNTITKDPKIKAMGIDANQCALGPARLKIDGKEETVELDREKGKASLKKLERGANKTVFVSTPLECKVKGSENEVEEDTKKIFSMADGEEIDTKVEDEELLSKKEKAEAAEMSPNAESPQKSDEKAKLKKELEKKLTTLNGVSKNLDIMLKELTSLNRTQKEAQEKGDKAGLEKGKKALLELFGKMKGFCNAWDTVYGQIEDSGETKIKEQLAARNEKVQILQSKIAAALIAKSDEKAPSAGLSPKQAEYFEQYKAFIKAFIDNYNSSLNPDGGDKSASFGAVKDSSNYFAEEAKKLFLSAGKKRTAQESCYLILYNFRKKAIGSEPSAEQKAFLKKQVAGLVSKVAAPLPDESLLEQ